MTCHWRIRGGTRDQGSPLFLDQTEGRRAEKNFFGDRPPPPLPPYLRVCKLRGRGEPSETRRHQKEAHCARGTCHFSISQVTETPLQADTWTDGWIGRLDRSTINNAFSISHYYTTLMIFQDTALTSTHCLAYLHWK